MPVQSLREKGLREWIRQGTPWIWLNAGALAISLMAVLGLLGYIFLKGVVHFWPHTIYEAEYVQTDGTRETVLGEIAASEIVTAARLREAGEEVEGDALEFTRHLVKVGNRDVFGRDFRWLLAPRLQDLREPADAVLVERREWGNFYGRLVAVKENGNTVSEGAAAWDDAVARVERANGIVAGIIDIQKGEIGAVNYRMEQLRLDEKRLVLEHAPNPVPADALAALAAEKAALDAEYARLAEDLGKLHEQLDRDAIVLRASDGSEHEIELSKVVFIEQPNSLGLGGKITHFLGKLWEFVSDDPRESNTEGGIFPAIFGTVMMVFLMTIIVTPFGVIAAIYLREYANQGVITRAVRIAVNNLAGVPSIVYGVFGLGFFVYFLGGSIDELFYPEAAPAPVFGTPGLLWASLTLALLTVPVVIVATEEGLSRVPKSIREGSLALGATKAETLWRVIMPIVSPAIMTGMILAIARAAGEVAPLMLVGVVKLAPTLPLDANAPFLHLDRKFMHLGFHIYDVGFQSPNVEAARPLVYATAFLLVAVVALLNIVAIVIRNRLRENNKALEN
ncbi:MAG: phosphate ABC transporter permease PstA [Pseudomonadota bacterium]